MDALKNFKDFLLVFNTMSETCFTRCVNTFQTRELTEDEDRCVELCSNKNIRVNHKVMSVYMEVQPLIMQKRMEEMEKLNPPTSESVPESVDTSNHTQPDNISRTDSNDVTQDTSSQPQL
ncbi:mitochondrial import inner membrane translocase subunit Tim10 B-like [Daphnia carinata]|uniref:mitochondrial import inner membrane translocase subunit Tim10 B-like n=1 Tax=Daphnia carinata TaxID=120202 RepID=UPI00257B7E1A|nr:mitochondrial import inner membrane translocase subunit Tim10 B-like [Daphnia carinata]